MMMPFPDDINTGDIVGLGVEIDPEAGTISVSLILKDPGGVRMEKELQQILRDSQEG